MIKKIPKLTLTQQLDFERHISRGDEDDCWLWVGSYFISGYGRYHINSIGFRSHRISYYLNYNVDPGNLLVCHTCDNPGCCNPKHLFLGTNKDNQRDCTVKGRGRCGERQGRHKLSECDVKDILNSRQPHLYLATKYGVNPSCIAKIRKQESWKYLNQPTMWKPPYSGSGKRKLTADQIKFIKQSTLGPVELGRQLGVSHPVITRIRHGLIYKDC